MHNNVTQLSLRVFLWRRPLWVEYPQDPATFALDDEFLIGETQNTKTLVISSDSFEQIHQEIFFLILVNDLIKCRMSAYLFPQITLLFAMKQHRYKRTN